MRRFKTHKEALEAYDKVREFVGVPFEQWLFDNKTDGVEINNSEDAADFIRSKCFIPKNREHFWLILLNTNHNTMCDPIVISEGLLDCVSVGAREVFGYAIWWQAAAIIVAHNHPSANLDPSEKDMRLTKDLYEAGRLLSIPVLDHVIVSRETLGFYSIREKSDLWESNRDDHEPSLPTQEAAIAEEV